MGLSDQDVARVAAEARVDVRTVRRALEGKTRMSVVREAVSRALRVFGFEREAARVERAGKRKTKG